MEECGNGKSVDGSVSFEKGYRCQADRVVIDQSQGLLLVTGHYGVCKPSWSHAKIRFVWKEGQKYDFAALKIIDSY